MLLCCPLIKLLAINVHQLYFYLCFVSAVPHYLRLYFACFQTQTASDNVSSLWNPWVQLFVCENTALIVELNAFFASPSPDVLEKLPELASEWSDFFVEGIYNLLLPLPVSITGMCVSFILRGYDGVCSEW